MLQNIPRSGGKFRIQRHCLSLILPPPPHYQYNSNFPIAKNHPSISATALKPLVQLLNIPILECSLARPISSDDDPGQAPLPGGFLTRSVAWSVGHVMLGKNLVPF